MGSSHLFAFLMRLLICDFMEESLISYTVFVSVWLWDIVMGDHVVLFMFNLGIWFHIRLLDINPNSAYPYLLDMDANSTRFYLLDMNPNFVYLYWLDMNSNYIWLYLLDMNPNFIYLFLFYFSFSYGFVSSFVSSPWFLLPLLQLLLEVVLNPLWHQAMTKELFAFHKTDTWLQSIIDTWYLVLRLNNIKLD